ncbi:hypothetical protein Acr_00g0014970 [Actinidia rufa]|uniref:F-box domain-containing protein n=1 Tax=Actinidia rufa TaxID=165716 RepID=A0A7J0DB25_9ERIC|nr:hypothetical protein Acr_00g0014970 [Actinidia rufa]
MEETNNNSCQLEEQGIITSPQTSEIVEDLPLDIVFNILSWTPVKSLLQWRSVSKLWRCIIDHPFFADMHISRGNEEPNMLLLSPYPNWRRTKLSFRLVEGGRTLKGIERSVTEFNLINQCRLMGSCNGLLCFEYNNEESYILLNPFQKGHVALPEATIKAYPVMVSCGLGFYSSTNTYKVVRVVTLLRLPRFVSRVEVHEVGTSSWREITEVPPCLLHRNPVFAHGALHWLVTPFLIFLTHDESFIEHLGKIVSFDVGKEKFNLTPHPSSHSKKRPVFKLLDVKGNLAVADLSSQMSIYIWVMKSYETKEWAREYKIEIHEQRGRYHNHHGHIEVIGVWENGEIVLKSNGDIFIYNSETGLRHCQSLGLESGLGLLFSHRGSLISLSQVTAAC